MKKKILCTLGPSSMNKKVISRLTDLGVDLFRINLSHTQYEDLAGVIEEIRKHTIVPICLDSEGAQVRTGNFAFGELEVKDNSLLYLTKDKNKESREYITLNYPHLLDQVEEGDFINIDFNAVLAQVVEKEGDDILIRILNGGKIGKNKAVTIQKDIRMPALTDKDKECFKLGMKMGISHYALSFANRASDVAEVREIITEDSFLVSKIECTSGLINLEEITTASDAILIDRGDLSREQPIERIPMLQRHITQTGVKLNREVYVATNLLETMIESPQPTRAEVNDIYNTLKNGADGLVLAAETAIGKYPTEAASMIVKLIHEYENEDQKLLDDQSYYRADPMSMLVAPHGGKLVNRYQPQLEWKALKNTVTLEVSHQDLMDCEQIAFGTYSPVEGFFTKKELSEVLENYALPSGIVWTLPLVLQLPEEKRKKVKKGTALLLTNAEGEVHAVLETSDVFEMDLDKMAQSWFGTTDKNHPGVKKLVEKGNHFVGGKITLVKKLDSALRQYELTPYQTRFIFKSKGWAKVVGFHTRNIPHRAHEFIQKEALERSFADGLFISPVTGPKKKGDFKGEPILKSYQALIDGGFYPRDRVILGAFPTFSRYSGPREAVFTALCRKNLGCSHFIIGRDHTGVGNFYDADENQNLFEKLGNIGIEPVFFNSVGYNPEKEDYEEAGEAQEKETLQSISGTQIRSALQKDDPLPTWFIRDEVQQVIRKEIQTGRQVFY